MRNPINKNTRLRCQHGVTLVELIVSMVIISIALGGVLMVMNFTTSHSADPMIQHQAVAIAESYMEEILLQGYKDPDLIGTTTRDTDYPDENGETRSTFDDVDDYDENNIPNGIKQQSPPEDRDGNKIDALDGYKVTVSVDEYTDTIDSDKRLGPSGNKVDTKKITITVKHNSETMMILTGYRTEYD